MGRGVALSRLQQLLSASEARERERERERESGGGRRRRQEAEAGGRSQRVVSVTRQPVVSDEG